MKQPAIEYEVNTELKVRFYSELGVEAESWEREEWLWERLSQALSTIELQRQMIDSLLPKKEPLASPLPMGKGDMSKSSLCP